MNEAEAIRRKWSKTDPVYDRENSFQQVSKISSENKQ